MPDNTDPKQIVCTGEAGSDEWNCAFGTWSADDFAIDSGEPIGDGERLYVRRDLYDDAVRQRDHMRRALEPFSAMTGELFARNYDAPEVVLEFVAEGGKKITLDFADFLVARDSLQNSPE